MRRVGRNVHRCSLMRIPDQGSIFNARILRKPAPRMTEPTSEEADARAEKLIQLPSFWKC